LWQPAIVSSRAVGWLGFVRSNLADYPVREASEAMATTDETSSETIPAVSAQQRIARPSVDRLLDRAAERRICLVIGAAGSGKTTAVAAWSRERRVVWLPFANHGGDPRRLLSGVFGALQRHRPQLRSGGATAAASWDPAAAIRGWLPSFPNQDL